MEKCNPRFPVRFPQSPSCIMPIPLGFERPAEASSFDQGKGWGVSWPLNLGKSWSGLIMSGFEIQAYGAFGSRRERSLPTMTR